LIYSAERTNKRITENEERAVTNATNPGTGEIKLKPTHDNDCYTRHHSHFFSFLSLLCSAARTYDDLKLNVTVVDLSTIVSSQS